MLWSTPIYVKPHQAHLFSEFTSIYKIISWLISNISARHITDPINIIIIISGVMALSGICVVASIPSVGV